MSYGVSLCATGRKHTLSHTWFLFLLDNTQKQDHIQNVSHHGKCLSGPKAEIETLLHYCYSQLKYLSVMSVCLCSRIIIQQSHLTGLDLLLYTKLVY